MFFMGTVCLFSVRSFHVSLSATSHVSSDLLQEHPSVSFVEFVKELGGPRPTCKCILGLQGRRALSGGSGDSRPNLMFLDFSGFLWLLSESLLS